MLSSKFTSIANISRSKLFKDTFVVFAGNGLGQAINFIATIVILRQLGPENFGIYSAVIAFMIIVSQLADLGLNTAYIRYAVNAQNDHRTQKVLSTTTVIIKIVIVCLILMVGIPFSSTISSTLFHNRVHSWVIIAAMAGAIGMIAWGFIQAVLQAKERFFAYSLVNTINNLVKLLLVFCLSISNNLTLAAAVMATIIVPYLSLALDRATNRERLWLRDIQRAEFRDALSKIWGLGRWITLSMLATMILTRMDVIILQIWGTPKEAGLYASATQLAMLIPLITGTITTVLLPKAASIQNNSDFFKYIKNSLLIIPILPIVFIPLLLLSDILISSIFGNDYREAIPIFKILILGHALGIAINPLSLVFYTINKAHLLTIMNVSQAAIFSLFGLFLIPKFGAIGCAASLLSIYVFSTVYVLAIIFVEARNRTTSKEN